MKKTILLSVTLMLLLACETGVKNQGKINEPVLSGIVNRTVSSNTNYSNVTQTSPKQSSNKIFSNSAQPGYYLQMAVFAKSRPNKIFLEPLDKSKFSYIVLNKSSMDYVLIGPYKSYNAAKNNVSSVKSTLKKQTFVVQVLRP
jgi:uncharacterized protein YcgL (UPF0745 family)